MKSKLVNWLTGTGIVVLWILAGLLIFAIFTGTLWVTGGSLQGYPALVLSIFVVLVKKPKI